MSTDSAIPRDVVSEQGPRRQGAYVDAPDSQQSRGRPVS